MVMGGNQVGGGVRQRADLFAVVVLSLLVRHLRVWNIAVGAGTDASTDDNWTVVILELLTDFLQESDCASVRLGEGLAGVAEPASPVRVCPPGGALENQTGSESLRERGVDAKVP